MSTSVIAGIHVDVYGIDDQIRQSKRPLVVLFVLHGRYGSATEPKTVSWCNRLLESARSSAPSASKDLIIVAFDQRNHGRRSADPKRNFGWHESWQGESYHNETHAVDCFSMQYGTSRDVSLLIDLLPSHLFPNDERQINEWWCSGVSLGGHATWLVLAHEPRVSVGIPIIGCPDMYTLFSKRAARQNPPIDVAAPYFPRSFLTLLKSHDPCNVPVSAYKGRSILALSGEKDTLVNYVDGGSEAFVAKLRDAGVDISAFIDSEAGHEFSEAMIARANDFIQKHLS